MSAQRITIHQFHYSITRSDAVSNQMFFIQQSLKEIGIGGEIFAKEIKDIPASRARPLEAQALWGCDLLLLHHSQGNPALDQILKVDVPKALIYHNITPEKFFRHDPYIAGLCRLGRKQLPQIRRAVIANFADSQYNSWELETQGFPRSPKLPLFDIGSGVPAIRKKKRAKGAARTLLFVGKLAPHKNQALLVKVCYYLNHFTGEPWDLVLVGGKDPIYGEYVRSLAKVLGVSSHVHIAGRADDRDLERYYRQADAFVCLSLHEGFCIPLIEAMKAGVPVFALPVAAVKETLGGAGLQLKTQKPHRIAAIIAAALEKNAYPRAILSTQKKRLQQMRPLQSKQRVQKICSKLVEVLRSSPGKPVDLAELEQS